MSVNQQVNTRNQFTLNGYGYDAAGNLINDGSHNTSCWGNTLAWDAEEELACAYGTGYGYDGLGRRVEKAGGTSTSTRIGAAKRVMHWQRAICRVI